MSASLSPRSKWFSARQFHPLTLSLSKGRPYLFTEKEGQGFDTLSPNGFTWLASAKPAF